MQSDPGVGSRNQWSALELASELEAEAEARLPPPPPASRPTSARTATGGAGLDRNGSAHHSTAGEQTLSLAGASTGTACRGAPLAGSEQSAVCAAQVNEESKSSSAEARGVSAEEVEANKKHSAQESEARGACCAAVNADEKAGRAGRLPSGLIGRVMKKLAIYSAWDHVLGQARRGGTGPTLSGGAAQVCSAGSAQAAAMGANSLTLDAAVGTARAVALLDSGAMLNFVSSAWVKQMQLQTKTVVRPVPVELADGSVVQADRVLHGPMLKLDGWTQPGHTFYVIPMSKAYQIVLGMPWLSSVNPQIDWQEGSLAIRLDSGSTVVLCSAERRAEEDPSFLLSAAQLKNAQRAGEVEEMWLACVRSVEDGCLSVSSAAEAQRLATELVSQFADVFEEPKGLPPDRGGLNHKIVTVPGASPSSKAPYRLSDAEYRELHAQLTKLLELGHIRPSCSPYGAPVMFVKKKPDAQGKVNLRLVTDFRGLNQITVKDAFPLPTVSELLDRIGKAQVFSKLDLAAGFNQQRIEESSIHKTAFRTRYGHYEYVVVPFGLCNAPSSFQRLLAHCLQPLGPDFCMVYIDDILVFSKDIKSHAVHLRRVLERLREHQLYARASKCAFFQSEVSYLGHTVSGTGIEVDKTKVAAIEQWPVPRNARQLQSFLGAANYFRRFIARMSHVAAPLHEMLKKERLEGPWVWGERQQTAFEALKRALSTAPVLRRPDPDLPYILYTDASDQAVGAVLMQDAGEGPQPIAYLSRRHSPAERNYPTREKELLAIVEALKEWRYYLAASEVAVFTDHDSLRYLMTQRLPLMGRMARWLEATQEFNLSIGYVPGKANVVADALSRIELASLQVQCAGKRRLASVQVRYRTAADAGVAARQYVAVRLAAMSAVSGDASLLAAVKAGYASDEFASSVINRLNAGERSTFELQQGLLFLQGGRDGVPRLYIPAIPALRQQVLAECHDSGPAGHLGRAKTEERLAHSFFWPKQSEYVREYTRTCPSCQLSKPRNTRKGGLLHSHSIPSHAWDVMSMDFISGLPTTAAGHDAILTCVCMLTKMVRLIPCTKQTDAEEAARLVQQHVWSLFGTPTRVVSDRDPRFQSTFWQTLMRLIRTKLNMSTSFHPETDGQTERAHRVIEEILRHYVREDQSDWDELLPVAEFAINSAKNQSTGYSPFYLNYGREPLTPAAFLTEVGKKAMQVRSSVLAEQVVQTTREALARAKESIAKAQTQQAKYANRSRRELGFQRGDLVRMSTKNLSRRVDAGVRKLDKLWVGPLTVTEQVGRDSYRLALPKGMQMHDVVHVSLLEPYQQSELFPNRDVPVVHAYVPQASDEREWYIIDHFLDSRTVGRTLQYRVRWEGWAEAKYDTWEPATYLRRDLGAKTFNQLVQAFEKLKQRLSKPAQPQQPKQQQRQTRQQPRQHQRQPPPPTRRSERQRGK